MHFVFDSRYQSVAVEITPDVDFSLVRGCLSVVWSPREGALNGDRNVAIKRPMSDAKCPFCRKPLIALSSRLCSWCGKRLSEELLRPPEELRAEFEASEARARARKASDRAIEDAERDARLDQF